MTLNYFQKIKPDAVIIDGFGNNYAITHFTVRARGVIPCSPRLLRINDYLEPCDDGSLLARIGSMGNAIAQIDDLPENVIFQRA